MTDHSIFYYPYSSFGDNQLPLLKVVCLPIGVAPEGVIQGADLIQIWQDNGLQYLSKFK